MSAVTFNVPSASAGDDEYRGAQGLRHIGDRRAGRVEADEQPAGAFDEHQVASHQTADVAAISVSPGEAVRARRAAVSGASGSG